MKTVEVSAPSNIAIIKYMGKSENLRPLNASLSYTLEHLRTFVRLTESACDEWKPWSHPSFFPLHLSEKGQSRYLSFFNQLKETLGVEGHFLIESANNFPSDAGLASSASSFAALTMAVYSLATQANTFSQEKLANLSSQGSGSSGRSFFTPWAIWDEQGPRAFDLPADFHHQVIIVENGIKSVSSSEAHLRVLTSDLFSGRQERAHKRLVAWSQAVRDGQWKMAFEISWSEFWDMHSLFETSLPHFSYMTAASLEVLRNVELFWQKNSDGPVVTMDAGANVHLLYRNDQLEMAKKMKWNFPTIQSTIQSWRNS